MADTLESLEIEVKHSSTDADKELKRVTAALDQLASMVDRVLPKLGSLSGALKRVGGMKALGGLGEMAGVISNETKEAIRNADKLDVLAAKYNEAQDKMEQALANGQANKAWQYRGEMLSTQKSMDRITEEEYAPPRRSISIWERLKGAVAGVKDKLQGAVSGFKKVGASASKANGPLGKLFASLGRIAFYRVIRMALNELAKAFQEGLQNAYRFSSGILSEGHRFASALDSMTSAGLQMKNQLGAAFIALMTAIQPIVNAIIGVITRLADAMSQFLSAFTGGTYLKAQNVNAKFAEDTAKGAKAAKEWKNQLMGFDEINRLEAPSNTDTGTGTTGIDPSQMFQDTPISDKIKDFVDKLKEMIANGDWKGLGEMLGNAINSILPSNEQWYALGQKLGYGLNGAVSTMYHLLKTVDFKSIGAGIANFINGALSEIDFETWGRTLVRVFTAAIDFVISFLTNLDFGQIASAISNFFIGMFNEASEWLASYDWSEIGETVYTKLIEFIEGIDFGGLVDSFFRFLGEAFKAVIGFLDGFFGSALQDIKDYFAKKTEEAGGNAGAGFIKGLYDAWIGIKDWLKEHIVDPLVDGIKSLLGIASPSKVFEELGMYTAEGFLAGFVQKWEEFKQAVDEKINLLKDKFNELKDQVTGEFTEAWSGAMDFLRGVTEDAQDAIGNAVSAIKIKLQSVIDTARRATRAVGDFLNRQSDIGEARIAADGGIWATMGGFASGGFPDEGQLFMAREAGPEMVGTIGSRTAVANNDDIVAGIASGVYDAMVAAGNGQSNNRPIQTSITVNGREFMRAVYDDYRAVAREHGVSLVTNGA